MAAKVQSGSNVVRDIVHPSKVEVDVENDPGQLPDSKSTWQLGLIRNESAEPTKRLEPSLFGRNIMQQLADCAGGRVPMCKFG